MVGTTTDGSTAAVTSAAAATGALWVTGGVVAGVVSGVGASGTVTTGRSAHRPERRCDLHVVSGLATRLGSEPHPIAIDERPGDLLVEHPETRSDRRQRSDARSPPERGRRIASEFDSDVTISMAFVRTPRRHRGGASSKVATLAVSPPSLNSTN